MTSKANALYYSAVGADCWGVGNQTVTRGREKEKKFSIFQANDKEYDEADNTTYDSYVIKCLEKITAMGIMVNRLYSLLSLIITIYSTNLSGFNTRKQFTM